MAGGHETHGLFTCEESPELPEEVSGKRVTLELQYRMRWSEVVCVFDKYSILTIRYLKLIRNLNLNFVLKNIIFSIKYISTNRLLKS